jgi:ubiquinone/menaquinone biosynthesis C-methylase UbiE
MAKKGWKRTNLITEDQLDEFAWHRGFFRKDWDPKFWIQNFTELKTRDIALFSLGDIQGKSVLDIGCGQGMYMLTFLKLGAKSATGIDIKAEDVKISNEYIIKNGFEPNAIVADCTKLPFPDNSFDKVFSGDVFEHITVEQKDKCIEEIYRVLKPGGNVTIKTPNLKYLKLTNLFRRIKAVAKLKNPFKIHIYHTKNNPDNEHIGLTTHKELRKLFLDNTFHEPVITFIPIERRGFPKFLAKMFYKSYWLNDTIIITAKKPIFLGLYDK